nr:MAG TPA: hypothetical protein [Caudoviricetes sp.]
MWIIYCQLKTFILFPSHQKPGSPGHITSGTTLRRNCRRRGSSKGEKIT